MLASQSSSRPLQVSAVGAGALQLPHAPAEQAWVPEPHAVEHARLTPSSMRPSQSSSRPLHVSAEGVQLGTTQKGAPISSYTPLVLSR